MKTFRESRGTINSSGRSWLENSARVCLYGLLESMLFLSHFRQIRDWFLELGHDVFLARYFVARTFTYINKVFFFAALQTSVCIVTKISPVQFPLRSFHSTVHESSSHCTLQVSGLLTA